MNAPIAKIKNMIDEGLEVNYLDDYHAYATEYEWDEWNYHTQEHEFKMGYRVTLHKSGMPAFQAYVYDNIQDLANAMRDIADLRTWRKSEPEY